VIGENCSLGQKVYIGNRVIIGHNAKIQNNVSIYDDVTLEDDVFCGPSMVFTNVYNPRSALPEKYRIIMLVNPMTGIIETFKYGFFGLGTLQWSLLAYSAIFTIAALLIGLIVFNKTEKNFMDTV
jgi:ABC-type polysaccharide/polyol phosphate export permease